MNKTRVPKGEVYFFIRANRYLEFTTGYTNDVRSEQNNLDYKSGNYFLTNDEACAMIAKLQAVLKGADVIEMPSEEDIKRLYPVFIDNDEDAEFHEGMRVGVSNTIDYFKDKIVK